MFAYAQDGTGAQSKERMVGYSFWKLGGSLPVWSFDRSSL
jgi:hypothetical protein